MGRTEHGQISFKLKGDKFTSKDKTAAKGSKTNTDIIEYVTKTRVKNKWEKPKHVDTVVNNIQILLLPITNEISNTHNNQIPQVVCFETNLSKASRADQDVVSDGISYSYDRTT